MIIINYYKRDMKTISMSCKRGLINLSYTKKSNKSIMLYFLIIIGPINLLCVLIFKICPYNYWPNKSIMLYFFLLNLIICIVDKIERMK